MATRSRADFMREMGLTDADVSGPVDATEPPARSRRAEPSSSAMPPAPRGYGASSGSGSYVASSPSSLPAVAKASPPSTKQLGASSSSSAGREEFLRSLGISAQELAHPDQATGGSLEPLSPPSMKGRDKENVRESGSTTRAAAMKALFEAQDEDHHAPTGSSTSSSTAPPLSTSVTAGLEAGGGGGAPRLRGIKPAIDSDIPADATVDDIKGWGNQSFEAGDFRKAVRMYTRAIERDPRNAALYSNRSAAYLQGSKQMGIDSRSMALRDADKAIELKPSWFKAYSRRGDALFKLERWEEAVEAYETALALDPGNSSVQFSLSECRQMLPARSTDASWSATGVSLSGSLTKAAPSGPKKSAHEMVAEMRRTMSQEMAMGHEYRDEQLARFRSQAPSSVNGSFKADVYQSMTKPQLDKSKISEGFDSDAAAAYQRSLLDAYRRKKQAGGM